MGAALHPELPNPLPRRASALIMLGPPGAGKGTQSREISRVFDIPVISTGEMLREAVRRKTPLGLAAQPIMEAGGLVADRLVCALVEQRIVEQDCARGFILDGFPRNLQQALFLSRLLQAQGRGSALVLNLHVDQDALVKRLTGRQICPRCGTIYNSYFSPPQREGLCDRDGTPLNQRHDDSEEAIRARLREYETQTKPLIDYYRSLELLHDVDGNLQPQAITKTIFRLLKES